MRKTILTDMDGTLIKGSMVLEHAGYLIDRGIIRCDGSYPLWVNNKKDETLIEATAINYIKEVAGKKVEELCVEDYVRKQMADERIWYSAYYEIMRKKAKGARVIIISGSPNYLVDEVAGRIGVEGKGSEYLTDSEGVLTGEVRGMYCAVSKYEYVRSLEIVDKKIASYGDSSSDKGLFKHGTINTLVDPTDETDKELRKARIKIDKVIYK